MQINTFPHQNPDGTTTLYATAKEYDGNIFRLSADGAQLETGPADADLSAAEDTELGPVQHVESEAMRAEWTQIVVALGGSPAIADRWRIDQ